MGYLNAVHAGVFSSKVAGRRTDVLGADTYSWRNAVLCLGAAPSMAQMHCHPRVCGSDCTLTARHNCEKHGARRAGVGHRDSCAVNHQQMWRRAAVSIHVQLFALNHLVLRPPLMDSYTEWGSFRHSLRSLPCVLCYALCVRSSCRAARGWVWGAPPDAACPWRAT